MSLEFLTLLVFIKVISPFDILVFVCLLNALLSMIVRVWWIRLLLGCSIGLVGNSPWRVEFSWLIVLS